MTYEFEQFKSKIVDPSISVDGSTIQVKPEAMQIGVDVVLTTDNGSQFGVHLDDVPVENLNYEGYDNLLARVVEHLKNKYAV